MRKYTSEQIEAVLERWHEGLPVKAIEQETGMKVNSIARYCEGLERERVNPLLLPHDRLWFRAEDVFRLVRYYISEDAFTEKLSHEPKGCFWEKLWRQIREGTRNWIRFDTVDSFCVWLGLNVNELPDPLFSGWEVGSVPEGYRYP